VSYNERFFSIFHPSSRLKIRLLRCLVVLLFDDCAQLSQAINSPSVPTAVGKCKISIEKNKEKIEKYICLFLFIDILLLISSMLATCETSVIVLSGGLSGRQYRAKRE